MCMYHGTICTEVPIIPCIMHVLKKIGDFMDYTVLNGGPECKVGYPTCRGNQARDNDCMLNKDGIDSSSI